MLDAASKAFFQTLSNSRTLKRLASRHGISGPHAFARRFIAGEHLDDAIAALREIQAQGLHSTLDYLGESVGSLAAAETATQEYLTLIEAVDRAGVERNLSLKLTQLGLDVDRAMCVDNLRKILHAAARCGFFVRIDMESSAHTEVTLCPVFPRFRVGVQATIGIDTVVGTISHAVLNQLATLNYDTILACSPEEQTLRAMGSAVRPAVGATTRVP